MWKHLCVFLMSTFIWSFVVSEDCITPLGMSSKCVSLYNCPDLANLAKNLPSTEALTFLQKSHCGFVNGTNTPKVCCGPFHKSQSLEKLTQPPISEVSCSEDSKLPPRGKCGINSDGDRIYGGEVADPDDYPWMALIGNQLQGGPIKYKCGGSLINRRYVLTAGHCVYGEIIETYGPVVSVRLGEHDMSAKPKAVCPYKACADRRQEIAVESTYPHQEYILMPNNARPCPIQPHDIAIVRLAKRATYTYYVQPICLVNSEDSVTVGENMFIAGWGKTLNGRSSQVKRKLQLPIFDKEKCVKMFQQKGVHLNDNQICAGGKFKEDACKGDSGGPLMRKRPDGWEAVGLVSSGNGCGQDGWPGIYTSVAGYLGWINTTLQTSNQRYR